MPSLRHVLMVYRQISQFAALEATGEPAPLRYIERAVAST